MALQRLTALALVGALALGVSACGDDSPSPAPSTSSAAASPTPSATGPAAPVLPELAARNDAVGAKAFVKYYFEALTHAMKTGETQLVADISDRACKTCSKLIKSVHTAYEGGGMLVGDGWSIDGVRTVDDRPDGEHVYGFVTQAPQAYVDKSGNVVKRYDGKKFGVETLVRWRDGWVMREAVLL